MGRIISRLFVIVSLHTAAFLGAVMAHSYALGSGIGLHPALASILAWSAGLSWSLFIPSLLEKKG